MATIALTGDGLTVGRPTPLVFEGRYLALDPLRLWDVSDDGETFVFLEVDEAILDQKSVVLVTNWFEELKRLAPRE